MTQTFILLIFWGQTVTVIPNYGTSTECAKAAQVLRVYQVACIPGPVMEAPNARG